MPWGGRLFGMTDPEYGGVAWAQTPSDGVLMARPYNEEEEDAYTVFSYTPFVEDDEPVVVGNVDTTWYVGGIFQTILAERGWLENGSWWYNRDGGGRRLYPTIQVMPATEMKVYDAGLASEFVGV